MLINKYIIIKFIKSYLICLMLFFICFYIFSILNYLDDNLDINKLIILSLLSTLQIFFFIPEFIFFFSILLFWINLKSKLELFIVRQYISLISVIKYFLPILLLYSFLIFFKSSFSQFLGEEISRISQNNYLQKIKLFIDRDNNNENIYYLFKNVDTEKNQIETYNTFITKNNNIYYADYSSESTFNDNLVLSKSTSTFENNNFKNYFKTQNRIENLEYLLKSNKIINNLNLKKLISLTDIIGITFFNFLLICLTVIFFSRKQLTTKSFSWLPVILSLILIIYSYAINNLSVEKFNLSLDFLSIFFLLMIILKNYKYE